MLTLYLQRVNLIFKIKNYFSMSSLNNEEINVVLPCEPNKLLPQSRFGLGSNHDDMICMLLKYFRVVAMIYIVWLIG